MTLPIPNFETARVLVVGDIMMDRYWYGNTSRISPEAPVPVVHVKQIEEKPGGAANVALNIQALGAQVNLLSMSGEDQIANQLVDTLQALGIKNYLQRVPHLPTITKLRVLSLHQQLIRLDFEEGFQQVSSAPLVKHYVKNISDYNVVILSDYAKGVLNCAPELIKEARNQNIPVLIDPKGSDFVRYRGAYMLTPNRKEFEAVMGVCVDENELVTKGLALIKQLELNALLITRGEHGMTLIEPHQTPLHLPAQKREVYDVTGAGDTVIAVLGAALSAGSDLPLAAALANHAAGVVVTKLGAATVSVSELRRALEEYHHSGRGIITEDQLLIAIKDAHAHGERVVMTNGCFDILHAGHITYLEEAKKCGDRLIVAVNDDNSVSRLKGKSRPINSLQNRMTVLAGLSAVDWVVSFSEDTPERLICRLLPDILVKGGDYKISDIAGGQCILNNGGEVKILSFVDGCSTSAIINKINSEKA